MEIDEALEIVVARTGHVRYKQLCDPEHPAYHPGYISIVLDMAAHPWAAPPASQPEMTILRSLFCPFQRYAGCSCGKPYECGVDGTLKTAAQCRGCLYGYIWPST